MGEKEKQVLVVSGAILVFVIVFVIVLSFLAGRGRGESLEECKSLFYNGEGRINIVFFSDAKTAGKYLKAFLDTELFRKNKGAFNFFYIDSYKPECEIYDGVALFCYSKELREKAVSCPNDYIVVVQDEKTDVRSSSFMNVMSLNKRHPTSVFLHEFGHAFARLGEEYTPARLLKGSENCAGECGEFGVSDGCFEGCSEEGLRRSIDEGIMRTLYSDDYGDFNDGVIEERINFLTDGIIAGDSAFNSSCSEQRYYEVDLRIVEGGMKIVGKCVKSGCAGGNGFGDYGYGFDLGGGLGLGGGGLEREGNFSLDIYTDVQGENSLEGEIFSRGEFQLHLPFIEGANDLVIEREGEVLLSTSLMDADARPCRNE